MPKTYTFKQAFEKLAKQGKSKSSFPYQGKTSEHHGHFYAWGIGMHVTSVSLISGQRPRNPNPSPLKGGRVGRKNRADPPSSWIKELEPNPIEERRFAETQKIIAITVAMRSSLCYKGYVPAGRLPGRQAS